jgi:hypothetical protein
MAIYLKARRELLFERFLELWTRLERDGFRARLQYAASERVGASQTFTPASPDGNRARRRTSVGSPAASR